ncbi:MAG: hypothetical protein R3C16_04060 [Hyphomonadaceae bacterium]
MKRSSAHCHPEACQKLTVRRIILFTSHMDAMEAFYRDVVGLKIAGREEG